MHAVSKPRVGSSSAQRSARNMCRKRWLWWLNQSGRGGSRDEGVAGLQRWKVLRLRRGAAWCVVPRWNLAVAVPVLSREGGKRRGPRDREHLRARAEALDRRQRDPAASVRGGDLDTDVTEALSCSRRRRPNRAVTHIDVPSPARRCSGRPGSPPMSAWEAMGAKGRKELEKPAGPLRKAMDRVGGRVGVNAHAGAH